MVWRSMLLCNCVWRAKVYKVPDLPNNKKHSLQLNLVKDSLVSLESLNDSIVNQIKLKVDNHAFFLYSIPKGISLWSFGCVIRYG